MLLNVLSVSRSAIAVLALAGLAACSRTAEPPSKEDLKRLAAEDSRQYVGNDVCLYEFQWPVMTTIEADHTPTWYAYHDALNGLVAAGLAKRSIQHEKVEVAAGQTLVQPRLLYELTPKAAPLAQIKNDTNTNGKPATVLCFGKLEWDGNFSAEPVYVDKDSLAGLIFHSNEYDVYPAYREPDDDVVVSRLSYSLHFSPSAYAKTHEAELSTFIDNSFRIRKVYVDLENFPKSAKTWKAGKGWIIDQSNPGRDR